MSYFYKKIQELHKKIDIIKYEIRAADHCYNETKQFITTENTAFVLYSLRDEADELILKIENSSYQDDYKIMEEREEIRSWLYTLKSMSNNLERESLMGSMGIEILNQNRITINTLIHMLSLESHYRGENAKKILNEYVSYQLDLPKHEKDYPAASIVLFWCAIDKLPVYDSLSDYNVNLGNDEFIKLYIDMKNEESGKFMTIEREDLKRLLMRKKLPLPGFWFSVPKDNIKKADVKISENEEIKILIELIMNIRKQSGLSAKKTFTNQELAHRIFSEYDLTIPQSDAAGKKINRSRRLGKELLKNIDNTTYTKLHNEAERIYQELVAYSDSNFDGSYTLHSPDPSQ